MSLGFLGDLLGAVVSNESNDRAADATVEAADRSAQVQQYMFDQLMASQQPNIAAGNAARDLRLASFGIGPTSGLGAKTGLAADMTPKGPDYGAYVNNNPDVLNGWNTVPGVQDRCGNIENYGQFHWNTFGQNEDRAYTPTTVAEQPIPNPSTVNTNTMDGALDPSGGPQSLQEQAYERFLGSGFNQAATDVSDNDMAQLRGAYGAGGSLLSGSAQGAMMDRLARNRYGAYMNYDNALAGMSGAGQQASQVVGQSGMQLGNALGNLYQQQGGARASSYANQGANLLSLYNNMGNTAATAAGFFM
ncbi:MAG: hypothetical protein AAGF20_01005 [Pseudomonadota bacterium]